MNFKTLLSSFAFSIFCLSSNITLAASPAAPPPPPPPPSKAPEKASAPVTPVKQPVKPDTGGKDKKKKKGGNGKKKKKNGTNKVNEKNEDQPDLTVSDSEAVRKLTEQVARMQRCRGPENQASNLWDRAYASRKSDLLGSLDESEKKIQVLDGLILSLKNIKDDLCDADDAKFEELKHNLDMSETTIASIEKELLEVKDADEKPVTFGDFSPGWNWFWRILGLFNLIGILFLIFRGSSLAIELERRMKKLE